MNGHNLGRDWSIRPQQTLYVPVEWQKRGRNSVVVLELVKAEGARLFALDKPILNELQREEKGVIANKNE